MSADKQASSADLPQAPQGEVKPEETKTAITTGVDETHQAIAEVQKAEKPNFFEQITINTPLSRDEAMKQLLAFHDRSTEKAILDAFLNLRIHFDQTSTITFQYNAPFNHETNGHLLVKDWSHISMQGFDVSNNRIWYEHINSITGQPMVFAS